MLIKSSVKNDNGHLSVGGWVNIFDYEECNNAIYKSNVYNKEASMIIWPTKKKADDKARYFLEEYNLKLVTQIFVSGGENG